MRTCWEIQGPHCSYFVEREWLLLGCHLKKKTTWVLQRWCLAISAKILCRQKSDFLLLVSSLATLHWHRAPNTVKEEGIQIASRISDFSQILFQILCLIIPTITHSLISLCAVVLNWNVWPLYRSYGMLSQILQLYGFWFFSMMSRWHMIRHKIKIPSNQMSIFMFVRICYYVNEVLRWLTRFFTFYQMPKFT